MGPKRDYRKEYDDFHGKPKQIKRRNERGKARRVMEKLVGKKALKGKDVHHKDFNTANNKPSNLAVQSIRKNRSNNHPK